MNEEERYNEAMRYIRAKIDQMLMLMGTLPLRHEELEDKHLISLDPIGIIVDSLSQVMEHLRETNHRLEISQNEIRTILDTADASIVVYNRDWTIDECNERARQNLYAGRKFSEIVGKRPQQICECSGDIEQKLWETEKKQSEFKLDDKWITVRATAVRNETGEVEKMVFLYADITAQKQALEELKLYEKVFDNTDEGILVTDAKTRIIKANRAFGDITGYDHRNLSGKTPKIFKSDIHDKDFYRELWSQLTSQGFWRGEIFDRREDGSLIPLWQTISAVKDEQGVISNFISVINDISALRETQSRLDHLAYHDPLTDLPNRLLLQDRLEHAIQRSMRDEAITAVLFIDLDRFKTINDSLGHLVGDRLLQQVAKRIASLVRNSDTVARLGGDEFVILLEGINSKDDAARMAAKVIDILREPFLVEQHELHIGCSIGVSFTPDDGIDAVSLLKNADTAMYQVKDSGRNAYHLYSTEMSEIAEEKLMIETALRKVIQNERLYLEYQPIIDAATGRVTAAEALVRWDCPSLGSVSPARFIPVAEESNLIITIGQQIIAMAVAQLLAWREQGVELEYLSVNVSGPQLYHEGFAADLIGLLERHSIQGHRIQLEITENVLMNDMERCVRQLNKLRDYGARIAIDDFGTGYSSLSYLRSLPLDIIKVDRSFIANLPDNKNDCAIARAIINLASSLELKSVAEGIETEAQQDYVRKLGCDSFQGFLFSRPLGAMNFARYYSQNKKEQTGAMV
jgi:diguanylate cyclase (GGDEF)-like protein/PAS domain S-box-containing protein